MLLYEEVEDIKEQIIQKFNPHCILLFGSCAKGFPRENSDIDICIVLNYKDKRKIRRLLEESINSKRDIDFILYTPDEWDNYVKDTTTFANLISRTGVRLYG